MLQKIEFSMGLKWSDTISKNINIASAFQQMLCFYFLNLKICFTPKPTSYYIQYPEKASEVDNHWH